MKHSVMSKLIAEGLWDKACACSLVRVPLSVKAGSFLAMFTNEMYQSQYQSYTSDLCESNNFLILFSILNIVPLYSKNIWVTFVSPCVMSPLQVSLLWLFWRPRT